MRMYKYSLRSTKFLEYKIRNEDPKLGEKYIKQIKAFFKKMKEKFSRKK